MIKVEEAAYGIKDIAERYGLKLLELDRTDITLIARIGFSLEVFIKNLNCFKYV